MNFQGKTILITGGAMGIGAATAKRLAREGSYLIIADRDDKAAKVTEEEIQGFGGQVYFQFVDLADPESIETMGEEVSQRVTCLHGLVNNAGIARGGSVTDTSDSDWEPQVTINLRAPALCAKALLPLLKKGPGHIVNLSSEGGFRPRANSWVYDATKAGICAVTRNMACEFIQYGMRVNSVAPGWTVTEMHFKNSQDPITRKAELENLNYDGAIIRRLARPEEIAAVIAFLLSDDASYITATTIHVDGGRVAH
ncbi:SDR family oxidoreductase [Candidatus Poribacteria bacterium]|nr:SDR family oxidoreductase [Candidatus Poribacteria bacterium]